MKGPRFGPFIGINNVLPAQQIEPGELAAAVNVDMGDKGRAYRRAGRALFSNGAADSLFSHGGVAVFRRSNVLRKLLASGSSEALQSGVTQPVNYFGVGDRIYWSDGLVKGMLVNGEAKAWGITPPTAQPVATAVAAGALPLGRYLYALVYIRDGVESGTGPSGYTGEISGSITFSSIPVPADAQQKAIYLSHPNGRELYRAMVLPAATTSASYDGDTTELSVKLETQFKQPPPPASCIAEHNGSVLLGVDRFLLWTDPYRPDLCDPVRQSYRFSSTLRVVAPVNGGVFVGTDDAIEFLAGQDIATASRTEVAGYGAIRGTLDYVDMARIGEGRGTGIGAIFATQDGICVGAPGGALYNLTTDRYAYPVARSGAGVVRFDTGKDRYVAAMITA